MVATFFRKGRGRSLNALDAERDGRMPLTRAAQVIRSDYGCTIAVAKIALNLLHDGEWHHVGKYATEVKYYDTHDDRLAGVLHHIASIGTASQFEARRALLRSQRVPQRFSRDITPPGRIVRLAKQRADSRAVAESILGKPVSIPLRAWESFASAMAAIDPIGFRFMADAAKVAHKAGRSREEVVIAYADAGECEFIIRDMLQNAGYES